MYLSNYVVVPTCLSFDNYCHKLKNILVHFIAEYLLYHEDILQNGSYYGTTK